MNIPSYPLTKYTKNPNLWTDNKVSRGEGASRILESNRTRGIIHLKKDEPTSLTPKMW